jgi:hypothetical protein
MASVEPLVNDEMLQLVEVNVASVQVNGFPPDVTATTYDVIALPPSVSGVCQLIKIEVPSAE